jgi:hypothetical protein
MLPVELLKLDKVEGSLIPFVIPKLRVHFPGKKQFSSFEAIYILYMCTEGHKILEARKLSIYYSYVKPRQRQT